MLFYKRRPESLSNLSLFEYTTKYSPSTVANCQLKLKARVRQCEYAARRRVDAVVVVRAPIDSADIETFSKAMLYLHVPWRALHAIVPEGENPSEVLRSALDRDDSSSLRAMIKQYELLSTQEAQMRHQQTADGQRTQQEDNRF